MAGVSKKKSVVKDNEWASDVEAKARSEFLRRVKDFIAGVAQW